MKPNPSEEQRKERNLLRWLLVGVFAIGLVFFKIVWMVVAG
jgi:hypothetical protein